MITQEILVEIHVLHRQGHSIRGIARKLGLSNNSAEIRRIKKRIEELTRLHNSKSIDFSNDDFAMSVDNGQVKIDFSGGKPSDEVRTLVKGYSFKWSRYQTAWVRKATANAVAAAERLCNELQNVEAIY